MVTMKKTIFLILLIATLAFTAQTANLTASCSKSCCEEYNGTYTGGICKGVADNESYSICSQACEQVASGNIPCCGSAFVLMLVPAAAIASRNNSIRR